MIETLKNGWIAVDSFIRQHGVMGIILVILAIALAIKFTGLKKLSPKTGAEFDTDDGDEIPNARPRRRPTRGRK